MTHSGALITDSLSLYLYLWNSIINTQENIKKKTSRANIVIFVHLVGFPALFFPIYSCQKIDVLYANNVQSWIIIYMYILHFFFFFFAGNGYLWSVSCLSLFSCLWVVCPELFVCLSVSVLIILLLEEDHRAFSQRRIREMPANWDLRLSKLYIKSVFICNSYVFDKNHAPLRCNKQKFSHRDFFFFIWCKRKSC